MTMKTTQILLIVALSFASCNAQEANKAPIEKKTGKTVFSNTPKEEWKVTKEVDEEGNIIRYDSIYTWSYTNMKGDSIRVNVDSLMRSFDAYFNQHFPSVFERSFVNPIWSDSLFQSDFFKDDFFQYRFEHNFYDLEEMFHRMDSLRNLFFQERYPGLMEPLRKQSEKRPSN